VNSNASTSSQWRALAGLLATATASLVVDGYGAGKSPEWPDDRGCVWLDEVELAALAIALPVNAFDLCGYSMRLYTAFALMHRCRVRSLIFCTSRHSSTWSLGQT
jgi:pimeloyl-ACP methyl ester carboxylesterase